jgi:hypothetical protein
MGSVGGDSACSAGTREEPRREVAVEGHELIAGADDRDAEHSRESA